MGWLISWVGSLLATRLGAFIAAAMIWLGVGLVTGVAVDAMIDEVRAMVSAQWGQAGGAGQLGVMILEFVALARVDDGIEILLGAIVARAAIGGVRLGARSTGAA